MKMLTALFGSLKGIFGQTFLLTGLLPAGVLLVVWDWWFEGALVVTLLSEDKELAREALRLSLVLLGLALLFYAVHQPLLRFFESIPGRTLRPVRRMLQWRQLTLRQRIQRSCEESNWDYTAATWPERGLQPEGDYIPDWAAPRSDEAVRGMPEKTRELSRKARELVQARTGDPAGEPLKYAETEVVLQGLRALMELSRTDPNSEAYTSEQELWLELLRSQPAANKVLQHVSDSAYRRYTETQQELSGFPRDERWMKPTALGNRLAALDDYAEIRYGIPTSTLWSRLWKVVEEDERKGVADAQMNVHMLINLTVASLAGLIVVAADSLRLTAQAMRAGNGVVDWRAILFVGATLLVARVFYLSAVAAFGSVREHVTRMVDLKRRTLIEQLGFKMPESLADERRFFEDLDLFLTHGSGSLQSWPRKDEEKPKPDEPTVLEKKLKAITTQEIMIPKDKILANPLSKKSPEQLGLAEAVQRMAVDEQTHLLLLDSEEKPKYLLPKRVLDLFLAEKAAVGSLAEDQLRALRLSDLIRESPALESLFKSAFTTIADDASLAEAQETLEGLADCLDLVVTEDGTKASKAVGWVTNVELAKAARV